MLKLTVLYNLEPILNLLWFLIIYFFLFRAMLYLTSHNITSLTSPIFSPLHYLHFPLLLFIYGLFTVLQLLYCFWTTVIHFFLCGSLLLTSTLIFLESFCWSAIGKKISLLLLLSRTLFFRSSPDLLKSISFEEGRKK